MLRVAENSLEPYEKEEREVQRLMPRDRPKSRKYKEKRGPRYDLRKQRMKIEDPDLDGGTAESDDDMSLRNTKASLLQIAVRIAEDFPITIRSPGQEEEGEPTRKRPKLPPPPGYKPIGKLPPPPKKEPAKKVPPKKEPAKKPAKKEDAGVAKSDIIAKLIDNINSFKEKLQEISPTIAKAFDKFSRHHIISHPEGKPVEQIKQLIKSVSKMNKNLATKAKDIGSRLAKADQDTMLKIIAESWPDNASDFAGRAAVIEGINQAIEKSGIPASFAAPFKRSNAGDPIQDKKLIKDIVNSVSGKNLRGLDEDAILKFVQLISIYQSINKNPDSVSIDSITEVSSELSDAINEQAQELIELGMVMDTWRKVINSFKSVKDGDEWRPGQDEKKVLDSLGSVFGISGGKKWNEVEENKSRVKKLVEPEVFLDELRDFTNEEFGGTPEEFENYFGIPKSRRKRAATSNEIPRIEIMANRVAAYHGVDDLRGNPTDSINTTWRSIDKRYLTEDSYKSIIKVAQQYLQEDWLKYCWKDGADDAPIRAALDLAIHTADDNLYQSKIDSETYELLLNRLAKWGYDTFSETVLPFKKSKRSVATMNQDIQTVLRVASEVRETDPKKAVEIIANLRSMTEDSAEPAETASGMMTAAPPPAAGEEDVKKNLLHKLEGFKHLIKSKVDKNKLVKGLEDLYKSFSVGHTAAIMEGLEALEDMDEDELDDLLENLGDDIVKAIDDIEQKVKHVEVQGPEAEDLKIMLDGLLKDVVGEAKTSSIRVSLSALIKIAYDHPDTRPILLPKIVTAKKREKGKGKGKAAPPFGGKAAPPFGKGGPADEKSPKEESEAGSKKSSPKGKKSKSKGKKKKAVIDQQDLNW